jgi:hypothetical protein
MMKAKTAPKGKGNLTAEEQRNMILAMFFDDHGADGFLDLVTAGSIFLHAMAPLSR